jgi:hypothetical protein
MEACPKCNFSLAAGAQECPACGVVLAKLKQSAPPLRTSAPSAPPMPLAEMPVPNPYVPPTADVESTPAPIPLAASRPQPLITLATLEALHSARPWLGFIVGYGFVMLALMLVGAVGLLFGASKQAELTPLAIAYFLYALVGFAILLPLRRSAAAIRDMSMLDASASLGLEAFAVQQAQFWRRIGLLTVVSLVLIALIAAVAGAGIFSMME